MENPLELPAPPDPIKRIKALALDLAYVVIHFGWEPSFGVAYGENGLFLLELDNTSAVNFTEYYRNKWSQLPPYVRLMESFGYFDVTSKENYQIHYMLRPEAFALLEKPLTPPSVFISYKQSESSALALLIESRLKNIDPDISIFIDKNIESGESINSRIEKAIEKAQFFICLLGLRTLADSTAVKSEIDLVGWNSECVQIPICHNGYIPDDIYTKYFRDNKAIVIKHPESAEEYEINMTRLLIRLGYSTT